MTVKIVNSDSVSFGPFVEAYERLADLLATRIGLQALDLAGISSGDRIIDVAAGTGAMALAAAERVGGGKVS